MEPSGMSAAYQPVHIDKVHVQTATQHTQHANYTILWAYFILGTLNNLLYVVILSSAQSIAVAFNASQYIGVIAWANVFAGMLIRIVNTVYWLNTSSNARVLSCAVGFGLATVGLAVSVHISFPACIACIIVLGSCSSLAESVILGYMKCGDSHLVGYWSSGTGMAGVAGTVLYLALYSGLELQNSTVYLLLSPTCLLYGAAWVYVHNETRRYANSYTHIDAHQLNADCDNDTLLNGDTMDSAPLQSRSNIQVLRYVASIATQLAAVYMFEYVVSIEFASRSNASSTQRTEWTYRNAYEILAFCYQFGVLLARSSIQYIQIKRIYILTLLQALNLLLWLTQVYLHWMPLYAQFSAMVYVGILGGLAYVNCFSLLMNDKHLSEPQRELAVNYTQIAINLGIVASAMFDVLFDRYALQT